MIVRMAQTRKAITAISTTLSQTKRIISPGMCKMAEIRARAKFRVGMSLLAWAGDGFPWC